MAVALRYGNGYAGHSGAGLVDCASVRAPRVRLANLIWNALILRGFHQPLCQAPVRDGRAVHQVNGGAVVQAGIVARVFAVLIV